MLICIISIFICRDATKICIVKNIVLTILGIIVFPLMYMISGGPYSAMIYWQILIIAITSLCLDGKARLVTLILQIFSMFFIIHLTFKYPDLLMGHRSDDKVYVAVVVAFFCVTFIIAHVSGYIIHRYSVLIDELEKNKLQVEKANKSKSIFLASMSHEIRTPLNAIIGLNDINLDSNSIESIKTNCIDIKHSSEILLGIINDILDFSKLEDGKFKIVEEAYSPNLLISELRTLEHISLSKGIAFEIKEDKAYPLPKGLKGDINRIIQIGLNVINNAIKYTDNGSVKVSIAYIKYRKGEGILNADGYIELIVQDTGKGIKEKDKEKLFKAFERIDEKINNHVEGAGLGLAIVKELVALMHGNIIVESEYGVGSTFIIKIPQQEVNYVKELEVSKTPDFSRLSVVCVDDTMINLKVFEGLVKKTGCVPVLLSSGNKCIDYFKDNNADIIFLDIMMPEMSGDECLKKLRQMNITAPCIALTADAVDNAEERYEKMGFNGYLCKPINKNKLIELLGKADIRAKSANNQ